MVWHVSLARGVRRAGVGWCEDEGLKVEKQKNKKQVKFERGWNWPREWMEMADMVEEAAVKVAAGDSKLLWRCLHKIGAAVDIKVVDVLGRAVEVQHQWNLKLERGAGGLSWEAHKEEGIALADSATAEFMKGASVGEWAMANWL